MNRTDTHRHTWLLPVAFVLSSGCGASAPATTATPPSASSGGSQHAGPHWSYEGEHGAEHWADLSPDFATCRTGVQQSPVDITAPRAANGRAPLEVAYRATPARIVNNGHTIQVDLDEGNTLRLEGREYRLVQFHFHSPSEHRVSGQSAALEMHLVHRDAEGHLAVVGIMLREGAENAFLAPLWASLPHSVGAPAPAGSVDASAALPAHRGYYHYAGSLTTPPCTEGVQWFVLHDAMEVSHAQVEAFTAAVGNANARPAQPLGERTVEVVGAH